jgi:hypothetical protein
VNPIEAGVDSTGSQFIAVNVPEYLFYQMLQQKYKTLNTTVETQLKFAVVTGLNVEIE